jgi:hypothetical protein
METALKNKTEYDDFMDNTTDKEKEMIWKLYFEADDYQASREWLIDFCSGYENILELMDMELIDNIGKNDDGDDVFELTEKALKIIKDNISKVEKDYKIYNE